MAKIVFQTSLSHPSEAMLEASGFGHHIHYDALMQGSNWRVATLNTISHGLYMATHPKKPAQASLYIYNYIMQMLLELSQQFVGEVTSK